MITLCGLLQLCNRAVMHLFRAEELEQLVCGSHHLDTLVLQAGAHYDDGYTADSQVGSWTDAGDWQSEGAVRIDASWTSASQRQEASTVTGRQQTAW